MSENSKKILIGVAWPYVNGDLHPGHIAGCYLPSDIFARFQRLAGNEVLMVSGSDCFGTPITIQADKEGVKPKDIVEKYSPRVTDLLTKTYNISFDSYTKTDSELHKYITQRFFLNLLKEGKIINKKTVQYYSEVDKKFLPDRYVEGECPHCHAKEQRGDQCESCGRSLGVGELINPYAKLTKNPVTLKETEHYFVDLGLFKKELHQYIDSKKDSWRPWVWQESNAWVEELQDRAITRDIDWGVEIPIDEIPQDKRIEGSENKRFYVWFDAVIGYFSEGIKWRILTDHVDVDINSKESVKDFLESEKGSKFIEEFLTKFWNTKDESLEHYYFVGKDNLFFHTLWWQSLLLGQGKNWNISSLKLANNVPVNQFLNLEGHKFSKSRGIYIDSTKLVEKFGLDSVRFYLASIMPENSDANWKWDDFITTNNNELVANLGNYIHRTLTFAGNKLEVRSKKFKKENCILDETLFDAKRLSEELSISGLLTDGNQNIFSSYSQKISRSEFKSALEEVLKLSTIGNIYFDQKAPWKSLTTNRDDCEKTIYNCLQIVNALRILIHPFLPDASDKLSDTLGLEKLPSRPGENTEYHNFFEFNVAQAREIHLSEIIEPLFKKIENVDVEGF